jgi:ArsR family transcriptional regulator
MDEYARAAGLFRALGHPVRLQILEALAQDGEACVCHLECRLGKRQPLISQQLMRLKEAGLVTARREGLNIFYSLADRSVLPVLGESLGAGADAGSGRRRGRGAGRACPCPRCSATAAPAAR